MRPTFMPEPRIESGVTLPIDDHYGATVDVMSQGGQTWITRVLVPREYRGRGWGRKVMAKFLALADAKGVKLFIAPAPYPDSPLQTRKLVAWYRRLGFVEIDGGHGLMSRKPKKGA